MNIIQVRNRPILSSTLNFLAWVFVFSVIYAQSPIYTSNQNQYFLHGLAQAGFGYLEYDWLANTLDPTPVFSALVSLTYRIFNSGWPFYAYYGVLLGIYLYSLIGIARRLFDLSDPLVLLAYLAILLLIHSAALRFFISTVFGPDWKYILEGGVANQLVLGAVFQPSTFGVLLVFSISLFLQRRDFLAVLPMAAAVAFHPTYLLSAGVITLSYQTVSVLEERNLKKAIGVGLLALLLVFPTLLYVFSAFGSTPPETTSRAQDLMVHYRIPHHAVIGEWFDGTEVFHILIVLGALYLARGTRLFTILLFGFLFAAGLAIVQALTNSSALALLFPWRISTILVPVSMAVILAKLLVSLFSAYRSQWFRYRNGIRWLVYLMIGVIAVIGAIRFVLESRLKYVNSESAMMSYVAENKSQSDVFLTPTKMQDFRLATGAPVYVDFKSIPYQDAEFLEWYRRNQAATQFYEKKKIDCQSLDPFIHEGVNRLVLENGNTELACDFAREIYADNYFTVFSLRR